MVATAGCGDDDGGDANAAASETTAPPSTTATSLPAPTGPVSADDLLALTGDAPAARGAGLDEPPGDPDRTLLEGFGETAAAVTTPDGTVIPWCLLLAASQEQRNRGLMEVTDLRGYAGMVFVWTEDMDPCPEAEGCPLFSARGPYRFAVEVPQGELDRLGIGEGSRLAVGGPCA